MQGERVVVWDLPTRIFHWLLATAFLVEWLTQDDARYLDFHVFCGYLIGALIAFRVIWGFVGTRWARFASFAFGPFAALRYLRDLLRRRQAHFVGHNPAGSWSIFILLTLGALSVLSGVAALGGEKQQGPLQGLLTFAQGDALRDSTRGPRLDDAGSRRAPYSRRRREQFFRPGKSPRGDDSRPQTRAARRSVGLARQQCGDRAAGGARGFRRLVFSRLFQGQR